MRPELAAAFVASFVAGLFGLIPLMVQIATTRVQRRDRMTRLNHLRAELELLEHLHTLQGKVGTTDEAAKPQTNQVISDTLSKVLEQYNNLSEIAPSRVVGGKPPSRRQLSFFRRAFLLYNPHTISGWILHTLFYMIATIFVFYCIGELSGFFYSDSIGTTLFYMGVYVVVFAIPLLILQRLARRNAAQIAAQPEESDGT
jgi:hypothetical protein